MPIFFQCSEKKLNLLFFGEKAKSMFYQDRTYSAAIRQREGDGSGRSSSPLLLGGRWQRQVKFTSFMRRCCWSFRLCSLRLHVPCGRRGGRKKRLVIIVIVLITTRIIYYINVSFSQCTEVIINSKN